METYISENTFCNLDDFNSTEPQLSSASAIDINQKSTASPLGEDLKILFDNQILCDVKLRTTTDTFHAHKIILSARSPVFRAMFTSDMKENVQQCVEIQTWTQIPCVKCCDISIPIYLLIYSGKRHTNCTRLRINMES
ncbi:hypothetical protein CEXT_475821 [Caerostris extrusa]|uniref:BTB domain-containing protein n=1 Tax=Caerostris extrusa TaxID=172846 RepID=A0AAV4SQB7_CAEEX|nr:hypothetical protein CEXT_475821 [Caerostris extrusa]